MRYFFLILCIFSIICTQSTIALFSFKKMYSYIVPQKIHEEVVYEEYDAKKVTILTVKNKLGNVTVRTDPKQSHIFVKAIKKTLDPIKMPQLTFAHKATGPEMLIQATYDETIIDGNIDFEIIVPQKLALAINTLEGSIAINDPYAPTRANTNYGPIEINNAHNSVDAVTQTKGTITFHNPSARIKAQTNSGNIIIHDAHTTVVAEAKYGSIEMFAKGIPSTSTITLATVSGAILLHLPSEVNADIQAYTKHGIITCDHFITLKPQTTQLNRQAWKRLQKQIDGVLGTGEAQIKLSSVKSDIKLLEMKNT
jgi:DUF4097 and DUF4098 domain-containing protein YvlB